MPPIDVQEVNVTTILGNPDPCARIQARVPGDRVACLQDVKMPGAFHGGLEFVGLFSPGKGIRRDPSGSHLVDKKGRRAVAGRNQRPL